MSISGNPRLLQRGIDRIIEDQQSKTPQQREQESIARELKIQELRDRSYVLINSLTDMHLNYTEQDILDGKTGLNGQLYHMGYRSNEDGTWRKKGENDV